MPLEDYTNLNKENSFCYWLESRTSDLGSIWGGSSYKFGIYRYKNKPSATDNRILCDDQYAWYAKYGKATAQEAYKLVLKAVKEVRNDLNILKSQCGARVRDYLLGIVHKITPESNLEELQKSELLGTAEITLFLKKHIPKTFEEVGKRGNWDVDQAAVRGIGEGNHDESRQILPRNVR